MLGDFDARVDYCKSDEHDEVWCGVSWTGYEESGWTRLLGFCEINHLSIMNIWFQKKRYHYGTYIIGCNMVQDVVTSMIDYVVVCSGVVSFVWIYSSNYILLG